MSKKPWFRWYRDTATDAKFRLVRLHAGDLAWPERADRTEMVISLSDVVATWALLLECVTDDNGSVTAPGNIAPESYVSAMLDLGDKHAKAILDAMRFYGLFQPGGGGLKIKNWQRRQYLDTTNAERQSRHRERKKGNAGVTPRNAERNGTVTHRQRTETETETETEKKDARASALVEFDLFWEHWPNKVGKPKAFTAFVQKRKKHTLEEILQGEHRYIRDKPPDRPWLNPATFFNQERYMDRPAPVGAKQSKSMAVTEKLLREVQDRGISVRSGCDNGSGDAGRVISLPTARTGGVSAPVGSGVYRPPKGTD
jgi:hypothetical protein